MPDFLKSHHETNISLFIQNQNFPSFLRPNKNKHFSPLFLLLNPSISEEEDKTQMDPAELNRVFKVFDKNGDGKITKNELDESLRNLGIIIPDRELKQMMEKMDLNGDGYLDIDEFGEMYKSLMDEEDMEEDEDMKEAFSVFDRNGDGFIAAEELKAVLDSLGLKQGKTLEDCKKMIMRVDMDGDGRIDFNEFRQMMKSGGFSALN